MRKSRRLIVVKKGTITGTGFITLVRIAIVICNSNVEVMACFMKRIEGNLDNKCVGFLAIK